MFGKCTLLLCLVLIFPLIWKDCCIQGRSLVRPSKFDVLDNFLWRSQPREYLTFFYPEFLKGKDTKRKKTCKVNLGNQCEMEIASEIAEKLHFLNSFSSPGRKRSLAS